MVNASTTAMDSFERDGYLACQSVALSFALALVTWVSAPLLDPRPLLKGAILATAAAVIGAIAVIFELRRAAMQRQWFASPLPSLAAGLLAVLLLSAVSLHTGIAYAVIGAACLRMLVVVFQARPVTTIVPILAGAAVGYWAFLLSFVDGYKKPWIEPAIQSGTVHVDLFFHAAIANMLSGYDVGSLGVDGLAAFPYHFGSHRIANVLCALLGIEPLLFYSVVFPLIFGPLFICVMYFFVVAFRRFLKRVGATGEDSEGNASGWYWAVFAIFFVGVIATPYRRELGVWDNVFHSESFGIAVLCAYLGGIWLFDQLGGARQLRLTWWSGPMLALYLAALCVLKISVGLVMGCVFAYALLRSRMPRLQQLPGLLVIALPLAYGFWLTRTDVEGAEAGPGLISMLKPFAFLRESVNPDRYLYSFLAFFGPLITFAALRLLSSRSGPRPGLWSRVRDHALLDVELAIAITVAAIVPGLVLSVPQGSTNFFAEVAYWWVQPMAAVVMSSALAIFASPKKHRYIRSACGQKIV